MSGTSAYAAPFLLELLHNQRTGDVVLLPVMYFGTTVTLITDTKQEGHNDTSFTLTEDASWMT